MHKILALKLVGMYDIIGYDTMLFVWWIDLGLRSGRLVFYASFSKDSFTKHIVMPQGGQKQKSLCGLFSLLALWGLWLKRTEL